jgi:predicted transcriptional regulator
MDQNNMQVPISLYESLSIIAYRHGITQTEWAKAAGIPQPRIAELEKLLRISKGIQEDNDTKRAFTLQKMHRLYLGLKKLLGVALMSKEMSDFIKKNEGTFSALTMMTIEQFDNEQFIKEATAALIPIYLKLKKDDEV